MLGLSAYESGWGSTYKYRKSHNPFGFTPGGSGTKGTVFKSYDAAWKAWGQQWGNRVQGTGSNLDAFVGGLLTDNRGAPDKNGVRHGVPGTDKRGSYNTENPNYAKTIKSVVKQVQDRIDDALAAQSAECKGK